MVLWIPVFFVFFSREVTVKMEVLEEVLSLCKDFLLGYFYLSFSVDDGGMVGKEGVTERNVR